MIPAWCSLLLASCPLQNVNQVWFMEQVPEEWALLMSCSPSSYEIVQLWMNSFHPVHTVSFSVSYQVLGLSIFCLAQVKSCMQKTHYDRIHWNKISPKLNVLKVMSLGARICTRPPMRLGTWATVSSSHKGIGIKIHMVIYYDLVLAIDGKDPYVTELTQPQIHSEENVEK